jgi:hypothetical protein
MSYPLRIFYDCSTAHLCPATRDFLEAEAAGQDDLIAATPYGWFLWADEKPSKELPSDLAAIIRRARKLGAEYVLFDCDAPLNDEFPVFEDHPRAAGEA